MSSTPVPFEVSIPQQKLEGIQNRVKNYPWHLISTFDPTWKHGPPPDQIRQICDYWTTKYDWRKTESTINGLPQFTAAIQGHDIHFVHEKGSGSNPKPLLLIHGWPYSFHSYTGLVERLAHPERFGGKEEDAFSVVVPSLPGFAFSSKPTSIVYLKDVEAIFNTLMTATLGYKTYIAHGGDWGAHLSERLAFHYPESCVGIHITLSCVRHHGAVMCEGKYAEDASEAEKEYAIKEKEIWDEEKAYNLLQQTKPLKLAYAMMESPVGIAAWILEAWNAWSDRRGQSLTEVFSLDVLLDEVMMYLVNDSFNTSMWIYAGFHEEGLMTLPEGEKMRVPVGVLAAPDPVFPMPPQEVLERSREVVLYTKAEKGGHFPFYECPDVVVEELRKYRTIVRGRL
ncbi:epoxide hydrolase [Lophiotrema nucula]|uniref:Epoxide hydrolase n=1 Tax=Lophiotrema nucula TaxID=690887 RepID=A0A6A5ZE94_9PLEO|nr:epoxide hydrolase [Lophiotrema nucula]